jgi:hypothetical protein
MVGTLQKKGDLKAHWTVRFVEIRGPWVSYWETSAKKHKKGEIHVGGSTCVKDPKGGERCVSIIMAGQHQHVHTFRTMQPARSAGTTEESTQTEFEQWHKQFSTAGSQHEIMTTGGTVDLSMLQDLEAEEDNNDGGVVEADMLSWCLVFRIDHEAGGDIPIEALEVARNLTAAKLHVEDRMSKDHARLFLRKNTGSVPVQRAIQGYF